MAPVKEVTLRERPRHPYFDEDCRSNRRKARQFEKVFKAKKTSSRSNLQAAIKSSCKIVHAKAASFWKTVDNILGEAESRA